MLALLKYWQIGVGVALGALIAWTPFYHYGVSQGKRQAALSAVEQSVDILRERKVINEIVSASNAAALCADLGLPDDDKAECVRRLRKAPAKP